MPPDRRLLREIHAANKIMKRYQFQAGQWAQWYRFDLADTTSNPIYDTGPQRVWYPAITLPVILGEYSRAPQNFDDSGLYLLDRLHLIFSYDAFFHTTMVDPDPTGQDHLNDRVGFDGHLFSVNSFIPRGRTASHFLTVSCDLQEVAQEDFNEDVDNSLFTQYIIAS